MVDETAATNPLTYNISSFLSNFNIDASAAMQTFGFLQNKKILRWATVPADLLTAHEHGNLGALRDGVVHSLKHSSVSEQAGAAAVSPAAPQQKHAPLLCI